MGSGPAAGSAAGDARADHGDGYRVEIRRAPVVLEAERTRAQADLALEYRKKGLLWCSTYSVRFAGNYTFRNSTDQPREILLIFLLPARQAVYDDLTISADEARVPFGRSRWSEGTSFRSCREKRGLSRVVQITRT